MTAYRTAFGRRHATFGLQAEPCAGVPVWVLPNPSGLNAHFQRHDLARVFGELRSFVDQLAADPTRIDEARRRSPPVD